MNKNLTRKVVAFAVVYRRLVLAAAGRNIEHFVALAAMTMKTKRLALKEAVVVADEAYNFRSSD